MFIAYTNVYNKPLTRNPRNSICFFSNNFVYPLTALIESHSSNQNDVSYWLGGNDIETEGVFKWVKSDHPMTYTDWSPGQPDGLEGEDCMEMRGAFQYHWNDLPCNIPHHFICETPYVVLL